MHDTKNKSRTSEQEDKRMNREGMNGWLGGWMNEWMHVHASWNILP